MCPVATRHRQLLPFRHVPREHGPPQGAETPVPPPSCRETRGGLAVVFDSAVQGNPVWAGDTKLKRPPQGRRSPVPSSQPVMTGNPPGRARKGDLSTPHQHKPHSAPAFRGAGCLPVPTSPAMGGPGRASFRRQDGDFYSILSSNPGQEGKDMGEELLVVGTHPSHSLLNHKRSRFGGMSAPNKAKNKHPEENADHSSGHSLGGDLSVSLTSARSSDTERSLRLGVHCPLCPTQGRNPRAGAESHSYLPGNGVHGSAVRGPGDTALRGQPRGFPFSTEGVPQNPQGGMSLVDPPDPFPSRMHRPGYLQVPRSPQDNRPSAFFVLSEFLNHNDGRNRLAASGFTDDKDVTKIKADPERLKKLQESLLEEDVEEDGDSCRICRGAGASPDNPLLQPCGCVGSLRLVHRVCLETWLKAKIAAGAALDTVRTCEMCRQGLLAELDGLHVAEFYQKCRRAQAQSELMNSGLYLVMLLHLYEQRFAELLRLNYGQAAREQSVPPKLSCGSNGDMNSSEKYTSKKEYEKQGAAFVHVSGNFFP
ncbi:probable E3 ubiquitin-protein ligase MARCH10 [Carlito syrichta]|uniref:RING-type E3 ubiquitin transferase n=1 Tax=Carlito syrichta TaxID=1868482 RepID=A0A3Q0DV25_CARSF|nr:probable E3 ubiquitin-protein ligase MARCH10 [Carlito syrichta]